MSEVGESDLPEKSPYQSIIDLDMSSGLPQRLDSMPASPPSQCYGQEYEAEAESPKVSRNLSTMSSASVASQGPCHMALIVAPTPKRDMPSNGLSPDGGDDAINFHL